MSIVETIHSYDSSPNYTYLYSKDNNVFFYNHSTDKLEQIETNFTPYKLLKSPLGKIKLKNPRKPNQTETFVKISKWDKVRGKCYNNYPDYQQLQHRFKLTPFALDSTHYWNNKLKVCAWDIETDNRGKDPTWFPEPELAEVPIRSASFYIYTPGKSEPDYVNLYFDDNFPKGSIQLNENLHHIYKCRDECELIAKILRTMCQSPINIAFNSFNFDLLYIYNRAKQLGMDISNYIIWDDYFKGVRWNYRKSIHIDMYKYFDMESIRLYSFGGKYVKKSLRALAESLLTSERKGEVDYTTEDLQEFLEYNEQDGVVTYNLWEELVPIIVFISKQCGIDIQRLQHCGSSKIIEGWIFGALYKHGMWVKPKPYVNPANQNSDIKFKGAYVIEPIKGVWRGVSALDFTGMYPSIIKYNNIGFDTVCCDCCRDMEGIDVPRLDKGQRIWFCQKHESVVAEIVGHLRDMRANVFKRGDDSVMKKLSGTTKVFTNMCYGVFGNAYFWFFDLLVAQSVTAYGRNGTMYCEEHAIKHGIPVLYGDTDSVFLHTIDEEYIQKLISDCKRDTLLDLEKEKTFHLLFFTTRKKNYMGWKEDDKGHLSWEIKGLGVKKKGTPKIIKMYYEEYKKLVKNNLHLSNEELKTMTEDFLNQKYINIEHPVLVSDYVTQGTLKLGYKYANKGPQHYQAYLKLPENERKQYKNGNVMEYVKCKGNNPKPLSMTKIQDIDIKAHKRLFVSKFEQIYEVFGIKSEEINGNKSLDTFLNPKKEEKPKISIATFVADALKGKFHDKDVDWESSGL